MRLAFTWLLIAAVGLGNLACSSEPAGVRLVFRYHKDVIEERLFCGTNLRISRGHWVDNDLYPRLKTRLFQCAIAGMDGTIAPSFLITLRDTAKYKYDADAGVCRYQVGPGSTETPIDIQRLVQIIEEPKLRDQVSAFFGRIDPKVWHEFEAVIDGVAVRSALVPGAHGGVYELVIDGCKRYPARPELAYVGLKVF